LVAIVRHVTMRSGLVIVTGYDNAYYFLTSNRTI
jgi:hypothetical protein